MALPHTLNDSLPDPYVPETGDSYDRETFYRDCFMINGVAMPIPSSWQVDPKILTRDAKRKIASGVLKAPYICTVYTITWEYKWLELEDYQILRQAYIDHCTTDGKVRIYVATMDSNRKNTVFCTPAYTEDGFTAPIYRIDYRTKEHYYKDVKFTIVSIGGHDDRTNYFVEKSNFQTEGDNTFNKRTYVHRIKNIRAEGTKSDYYGIGYTNT